MTATQHSAQDSSKQVSQQGVSDAAIADTLDQIAQSINTSALDDVIAALRARELQQCPNCLNDGCHCATCNPFPGELQQAQVVDENHYRRALQTIHDFAVEGGTHWEYAAARVARDALGKGEW